MRPTWFKFSEIGQSRPFMKKWVLNDPTLATQRFKLNNKLLRINLTFIIIYKNIFFIQYKKNEIFTVIQLTNKSFSAINYGTELR